MKVALVQPNYRRGPSTGGYVFKANPPLGLCYIGSTLRKNNISVEIIDANAFNLSPEQVAQKIVDGKFDIVGVSILSPAYTFATKLTSLLPKNVLKVAGNAHSTGYWQDALKDGFDVVCFGEGELTTLELAQGKSLSEIKGIAYKDGDKAKMTPLRELADPNTLEYPARDLLYNNGMEPPYLSFMTMKTPFAPIFTSRGCPYNCYYCNKLVFGQGFRPRTAENVFGEIKELYEKYHVKEIDIADDCFNFDMARAEKICDMIIESKMDLIIRCTNGIRADRVDEVFLDKIKKAGCNYIAYGVESGNQEVLNKIPKAETLEQIQNAFKLTRKAGIKTTAFIIFGLEGDNEKTMQDTINFTKGLKPDYVSVSIMTPYPGTRLYEKIKKDGKFIVPEDWLNFSHTNPKMLFEHKDFPSAELTQKMFKKFFKEFYMDPRFIIRNMLSIRSWFDFKRSLSGLQAILTMVTKSKTE